LTGYKFVVLTHSWFKVKSNQDFMNKICNNQEEILDYFYF